ncbi:MAG: selenide, water dikinase SelD [Candidatus Latescibacterota bacterium]|nr:MAG: selenide, water dikinase SelD [Candidatus Latescibacterota bacterium]
MKPIYLDYNATAPIDPRVAKAMLPFVNEHFGNPSSGHVLGVTTKKAVEKARKQIADALGCGVDEVIFTSGGSESNNHAVKGIADAYRYKGNHIITSAVEHPSVTEVCRYLEGRGYSITFVPVDEHGMVDPRDVESAITARTILVTVMHANNEVGTVEPIAEITEIAHRHGVLVHTDCAQSIGKIPVRVDDLGVDLLTVAGHKLYAPKGIGALYIRTGVKLESLVHGAHHEMHRRAGTENVIEAVGLGEACVLAVEDLPRHAEHLRQMRDRLEDGIKNEFPWVRTNGHPEKRLPNTLSVSFKGLEANTVLSELKGIAASAGAACHSDGVDLSSVLEAMKVPLEYAMGTIRFSTGRFTTTEDIDKALGEITRVVRNLKPDGMPVDIKTGSGDVKLTQYTHGLGCACKLRPQLLEEVLQRLPRPFDRNILVGTDTADDAAVFKIDDNTAIVQTVDFFTPIVDDPFQFGAIAAANSLSDIYAMGGRPLFALNVVGFPSNRLPMGVLEEILGGAQSKADEAGISIIGGHTVDDTEPKYGLAVTGLIDPKHVVTNRNARPGDVLVLTKPIGTGVLSTALKRDLLEENQKETLVNTMASLNRAASEAMQTVGVNACTDVTGFGLLGHLLEMMNGSDVSAVIRVGTIPILPRVVELATSGVIPGGTQDNHNHTAPSVDYDEGISEVKRLVLNDAQTSGGLLISLPENKIERLTRALKKKGVETVAVIGEVVGRSEPPIKVEA